MHGTAARIQNQSLNESSSKPETRRASAIEYRFGRFILQSDERTLRCNGDIVALPPRAVEALGVLAAHQGEVCSKERLLSAVWGSDVDEANLTQSIYRLRRTLGNWDRSIVLETVPRRGYRLTVNGHRLHRITTGRLAAAVALVLIVAVAAGFGFMSLRSGASSGMPPSYPAGYYLWSTARSIADVRKSIPFFQSAIAEEPHNPLGYAGLADAYISLALREADIKRSTTDARAGIETARKAIAIGPTSSEAHAAYGQAQVVFGDPASGPIRAAPRRSTESEFS